MKRLLVTLAVLAVIAVAAATPWVVAAQDEPKCWGASSIVVDEDGGVDGPHETGGCAP